MAKARLNTISVFSLQPQDLLLPGKIESSFLTANHFRPPLSSNSSGLEMVSIKSYTSLKDLLPLSHREGISWDDIPIKNKLVKKAALAYLQPMSSSLQPKKGFGCLEFVQKLIRDSFGQFFRANRSRGNLGFGFSVKANSGSGR